MATLGVQMFTLRQYTQTLDDLKLALATIRAIGYRSIQVSAFGDISPADIKQACDAEGIAIGGTHVAWDRYRNDLARVIEEHALWGCNHTAVGMIPPKKYLSLDGLSQFIDELAPITAALREAGMTFSYHNHAHEFQHFDGKPWLGHLYDTAPPSDLGAELDTHWIQAGGADPAEWITAVGDRQPLLHLKDFAINEEGRRQFAPVGNGNMNWDTILGAAAALPIEYYFIEQDSCYGADEFECLADSYRFLAARGLA